MNTFKTNTQRGMSLVGLMIGTLLCAMGILAATQMYHSLVDTAIDTRTDAQHDAELASAMLTLQLELQSAGFAIPNAQVAEHLAVSGANDRLMWRFQTAPGSGQYNCRGVGYAANPADNNFMQLTLWGMDNCPLATALPAVAWAQLEVLAEFPAARAPAIIFNNPGTATCFPYGRTAAATHGLVTITAQTAASLAGTATNSDTYNFCLPNFTG